MRLRQFVRFASVISLATIFVACSNSDPSDANPPDAGTQDARDDRGTERDAPDTSNDDVSRSDAKGDATSETGSPEAGGDTSSDVDEARCEMLATEWHAFVASHQACATVADCVVVAGARSCSCGAPRTSEGTAIGNPSGDAISTSANTEAATHLAHFRDWGCDRLLRFCVWDAAPARNLRCEAGRCTATNASCLDRPDASNDMATDARDATRDDSIDTNGDALDVTTDGDVTSLDVDASGAPDDACGNSDAPCDAGNLEARCQKLATDWQTFVAANRACSVADDCTIVGGAGSCSCHSPFPTSGASIGQPSGDPVAKSATSTTAVYLQQFHDWGCDLLPQFCWNDAAPARNLRCEAGQCAADSRSCLDPQDASQIAPSIR